MSLDDRLTYLVLGMIIGYIFGRWNRTLRRIEREVHEVDEIVKHDRSRNERGAIDMSRLTLKDYILLVIVLVVAYSAFASQKATNGTQEIQKDQAAIQAQQGLVSSCNEEFLSKTVKALNERTTFAQEQNAANVELQTSQSVFFGILLHQPPFSEKKRTSAAHRYFDDLTHFLAVSAKQAKKVAANPYPTDEELKACFNGK